MNLKPFISLDIETLGLNINAPVIELAAITYLPGVPREQLPSINYRVFYPDPLKNVEPYAASMHPSYFKELAMVAKEMKSQYIDPLRASERLGLEVPFIYLHELEDKLRGHIQIANTILKESYDGGRVTMAGKNVASFDLPMLRKQFDPLSIDPSCVCKEENLISHRCIDVGSVYLPIFGYVPSLDEINNILGRPSVNHTAYEDAMDVIVAIEKFPEYYKN